MSLLRRRRSVIGPHFRRPNYGCGLFSSETLLQLYNFSLPFDANGSLAELVDTGFTSATITQSATPPSLIATPHGVGLATNGTGNWVSSVEDTWRLSITQSLTVFLDCDWIAGSNSSRSLLGNNAPTNSGVNWRFHLSTSTPQFHVNTGSAVAGSGPTTATAYERLRLVGVYDGANVTCYMNGVAGTPASQTGNVTTTNSSFSLNRQNNGSVYDAIYRQCGIVNRVWSAEEVLEWTRSPEMVFRRVQERRYFLHADAVAGGDFLFRKTLSQLGTRTGSRQVHH